MRVSHPSALFFHSNHRVHFLPNGNHNPGELRQSQLAGPLPGGICHVEWIFLGFSEATAARADLRQATGDRLEEIGDRLEGRD